MAEKPHSFTSTMKTIKNNDKASAQKAPLPYKMDLIKKQRFTAAMIIERYPAAEGYLHIEYDNQCVSFGYTDLKVWVPQYSKWFSCNDKIITIEHRDMSVARAEFQARWAIYLKKRFNITCNFIKNLNVNTQ